MRVVWRLLKGVLVALVLLAVVLVAPIAYVETACRGTPVTETYAALLPPEDHRPEARTLMTYPEWHIVHAYDDYAKVIATEDPHDYGYLRAIAGYWSSLCALTEQSAAHGGVDTPTKQMVYVIGSSFTLELMLKAAYEETLGRVATWIRGPEHVVSDVISARQAAEYAKFLQQVPWYKWDFARDAAELKLFEPENFRDEERRFALGVEFGAKAAYAKAIAAAVAQTGFDALRLKVVVRGLAANDLAALPGVVVLSTLPKGVVIEAPRYRELTHLLVEMATKSADFVEIAGNDDILFTATSDQPSHPRALYSFARQGYGDYRHLILVKVADLAQVLRDLPASGLTLEHIHDY
ncbi:hypothetical protein [Arenibacterium sp. LLYu02]|uniref:hypothetical protein n=1 Tax=Arenibacterium sp. LLYu02 TaxID=3404132 RepID=UPI003B214397